MTRNKNFKDFHVDLYRDSAAKTLVLAKQWGKHPQKYHTKQGGVGLLLLIWDVRPIALQVLKFWLLNLGIGLRGNL